MTVCCSVKLVGDKSTKVVIASDSEVTYEEFKLTDVTGSPKIYQLNDAFIAISGMGPLGEALDIIRDDAKYMKSLKLDNRRDVRVFAEVLFGTLREVVEASIIDSDIVQHCGLLILATPKSIYTIWNDLTIAEHKYFAAVGVGGPSARGALEVLNEYMIKDMPNGLSENAQWELLEEVCAKAIKIASSHCIGCGGDTDIRRVVATPVKSVRLVTPVKKVVKNDHRRTNKTTRV